MVILVVNIWLIYDYYMVIIWLLYGYYMVIIWLMMVNHQNWLGYDGIIYSNSGYNTNDSGYIWAI